MMKQSWTLRGLAVVGVFALVTLAILVTGNRSAAGDKLNDGHYLKEAADRLVNLIGKANSEGFKLDDNKFSIGGGQLKKGADNWVTLYTLTLQKGKQYRILAAGDADASDVDLEILEVSTDKIVASDVRVDPEAVVEFAPQATQQYRVRVRLYAGKSDVAVCLAVVMVK